MCLAATAAASTTGCRCVRSLRGRSMWISPQCPSCRLWSGVGVCAGASPEMAGPMTKADRENIATKMAHAIAGAFQVLNRVYRRRSSGREKSSPSAPNSRLPVVPVTRAAPKMRPAWCSTCGSSPSNVPMTAEIVRHVLARKPPRCSSGDRTSLAFDCGSHPPSTAVGAVTSLRRGAAHGDGRTRLHLSPRARSARQGSPPRFHSRSRLGA